jgi:catechol-2,3-dioxygenase
MLDFYVTKLRLKMKSLDEWHIELRSNEKSPEPLLILRNDAKAERAPSDAVGLYHYALLVPDRASLAATYLALEKNDILFDGYADHLVSEALYLIDPDGIDLLIRPM